MTNSMTEYQKYIALSRYARWKEEEGRRETFEESVRRYFSFFEKKYPFLLNEQDWRDAEKEYLNLGIVGSMRALMTAGPALDRDNVAGYNCAYTAIEGTGEKIVFEHEKLDEPVVITLSTPIDFDETMYILMCGTGMGFSVERQYINNLPKVGKKLNRRIYTPTQKNFPGVEKEEISLIDRKGNIIHVHDSKYGWASALRILLVELYNGNFSVKWDLTQLRPAGAKLKTFGGRASGPAPLESLFSFAVNMFKSANGRKLNSIECHDLMCKIAEIVVVGGVRRSALISLSNLSDERMRQAKSGTWWETEPQRALANNSVCYTEKPDILSFMKEWEALVSSGSGERGIFYRGAAEKLIPERRKTDGYKDYGCNPCSEIVLRSKQFCNLSEVIIRAEDTFESVKKKIKYAVILGTAQATQTNFKYLNSVWQKNTEEEALLGVSLTGLMDNKYFNGSEKYNLERLKDDLEELREYAVEVNKVCAAKFGINPAAAVTCIKPSGTVSQLTNAASGIHARHSKYYIRTVRADKKDPLAIMMKDLGFPVEDDVMKKDTGYVFSFPVKSPDNCVTREDRSAIEQLELWKLYQIHWCEHKPSVTVSVKSEEWLEVGAWVYKNFDIMSGVSFLPMSEHTYQQAPYQDTDEAGYLDLLNRMPKNVDWSLLSKYEVEDTTTGMKEYACQGGACDVV